jgi:hypothetical protein
MTSSGFLLIFREKDVMTYQSLNPATGELLKKFDELTDTELETKIAAVSNFHQGPSRRIAWVVIEERGTHVLPSGLARHHPR